MGSALGGRTCVRGLAAWVWVLLCVAGCDVAEKLGGGLNFDGAPEAKQLALVEFEDPVDVTVAAGNYAFLLHEASGFSVLELGDEVAAAPRRFGPFATSAKVLAVEYDESSRVAYVADAAGTILVVDLTAPGAIRVVATLTVSALAVEGEKPARGAVKLARNGKRLFALKQDMIQPIALNKAGDKWSLSPEQSKMLGKPGKEIAASGGNLYIAFDKSGDAEIEAWTMSGKGELTRAGKTAIGGELTSLLSRGSKVLVLSKSKGLAVVDFYKPSTPKKVYENSELKGVSSARLFGRTLLVGIEERKLVSTLDVSDFASPTVLTTNKGSLPTWMALVRGNLLMGDAKQGTVGGVNPVLAAGVPPRIRAAFPLDGQIPLTFSKPIDSKSLKPGAITLVCGDKQIDISPWLSADGLTVNIRPLVELVKNQKCKIDFSGLNGLNDLPLASGTNGSLTWEFTTTSTPFVPDLPGSDYPHTADGKFTGCQLEGGSEDGSADAGAAPAKQDGAGKTDACEWFDVQPAQGRYTYFYADFDGENLHILNDWFYNGESIDPDCYNEFQAWTGGGNERWTIRAYGDQHVEVMKNGQVVDATSEGVEGGAYYGPSPNVAEPHTIYEIKIPASAGSWGVQLHDPGPTFLCNHLEADTAPFSGNVRAGSPGGTFNPGANVTAPLAPSLDAPTNGADEQTINPELFWSDQNAFDNYVWYLVEIASDAGFARRIHSATSWRKSYQPPRGVLAADTTYFWRVTAQNQAGSAASEPFRFTTTPTPQYILTTAVGGQGTITSEGAQVISCSSSGGTCEAMLAADTKVTLTATPVQGWTFSGWSGSCAGKSATTSVTLSSDQYCVATFTAPNGSATLWTSRYGNGSGTVTTATPGVSCGSDCSEVYAKNMMVTLVATPDQGSVFGGWYGDCNDSLPTVTVTMDADRYCTAIFNVPPSGKYSLNVWASDGGSVTSNVGRIDCPSRSCQQSYDAGATVQLTGKPQAGHAFLRWTGDCEGSGTSATLTMNRHKSCGAEFVSNAPTLTVSVSGQGTVTSLPAGIDCDSSATCSAKFTRDTTVQLTAVASGEGSTFSYWQGACSGTSPNVSVTMDAEKYCTAVFTSSALYVTVQGSGTVTSSPEAINCTHNGGSCSRDYAAGSEVTLTATPDQHYTFSGWAGSCTGTDPNVTLSVSGATYCTALFTTNTLNVYVSGTGTVTSSPAGISCSSNGGNGCSMLYANPTQVTLTAAPTQGQVFTGWGGCSNAIDASISVNVEQTTACYATFVSNENTLTLWLSGDGNGSISSTPAGVSCARSAGVQSGACTRPFAYNEQVTLTATPASNTDYFAGWSGSCSGQGATATVTMTGGRTCYATFSKNRLSTYIYGSGTVTSAPGGINCSNNLGTCAQDFASGTMVTLTATPAQNYAFQYWSGCSNSTSSSLTVTQSAARSCSAHFTTNTLTVYVSPNGGGTVTSDDSLISCTSNQGCSQNYPALGEQVTLTAAPAQDQAFAGWSGCSSSVNPSITVSVSQSVACYATFASNQNTLTLSLSGDGDGSVTSTPTGASCTRTSGQQSGDCAPVFSYNQQVTLTATPTSSTDYFAGWSGSCSGQGVTASVTMAGGRTCYATFSKNKLSTYIYGSGTVTSAPGSINCASNVGTCAHDFASGTEVTLTATPAQNYAFQYWSGCSNSTSSTLTLTQSAARTCYAHFTTYTLTVYATPNGGGTVSSDDDLIECSSSQGCSQNYGTLGKQVQLTASAAQNHVFTGWSGCSSSTNATITVSMNGSMYCQANFQQTVLTVYASGAGTITSSPGSLSCTNYGGSGCSEVFSPNTVVQLTATPSSGYTLSGWSGSCSGTNTTTSVTMGGARSCVATFITNTLSVDFSYSSYVGGSVASSPGNISCANANTGTCSANYTYNAQVTLTATATTGYQFSQWTGDCTGTNPVVSLTMTSNRWCYPIFALQTFATTIAVEGHGSVSSSPSGISCGGDCTQLFGHGTSVVLTATPFSGETFEGWTGDCSFAADSDTAEFQVTKAMNCTATFTSDHKGGVTFSGTFTSTYDAAQCTNWNAFRSALSATATYDQISIRGSLDPEGVSCSGESANTLCQALRAGTTVTGVNCGGKIWDVGMCGASVELHAASSSSVCGCGVGYTARPCLAQNGGYSGIGTTCNASAQTLEVDCALSNLLVSVTGRGTVTGASDDIDCPSDCSADVANGASVTLTATPADGETFIGWSGDCDHGGTDANVSVTVSGDEPVQCNAEFSRTQIGKVLILAAQELAVVNALRDKLDALGVFSEVDVNATTGGLAAPSLATLLEYDAVLFWTYYGLTNTTLMGDVLADYYDAGGRVVTAVYALAGYQFAGRFGTAANGYILISPNGSYGTCSGSTLGTVAEPASPLMDGVTSLSHTNPPCAQGAIVNGGITVASWTGGSPMVVRGVVKGRNRVDLNLWPNDNYLSGDYLKLIANALLFE